MNPLSLQVLCMKTIINNNLDYSMLPYCLQDMIDYQAHKLKFQDTLYILNTIYSEISNVDNILLMKINAVAKSIYDYDEMYDFIFIKYLYSKNTTVYKGTRFIQEITDLDLDN